MLRSADSLNADLADSIPVATAASGVLANAVELAMAISSRIDWVCKRRMLDPLYPLKVLSWSAQLALP